MVAKSRLVTTVTWPRPPRRCPTSVRDNSTSLSVMPLMFISAPARMKSGMASSGKLSSEVYIFCGRTSSGTEPSKMSATTAASPIEKAMGMPMPMNTTSEMTRTQTIRRSLRCSGREA